MSHGYIAPVNNAANHVSNGAHQVQQGYRNGVTLLGQVHQSFANTAQGLFR